MVTFRKRKNLNLPRVITRQALADQVAHHSLGPINPALYRIAAKHAPGLVDITSGSNTVSFTQAGRSHTVPGFSARPGPIPPFWVHRGESRDRSEGPPRRSELGASIRIPTTPATELRRVRGRSNVAHGRKS